MAGGGGTRLWPLSREHYPKQFLQLFENNTLFQNTLLRLESLEALIEVLTPVIICNEAHRFLVVDQGSQISKDMMMILEDSKKYFSERCPSGLRSTLGKRVYVNSVSRVRIPLSPPK